jgi:hypothetical protein
MQKSEVKIGGIYTAKVTNKLVQVRIEAESRYGGWDATNLGTNKKVRIKSAQRLRAAVGDDGTPKGKGGKKAMGSTEGQPAVTSTPTIEDTANAEPAAIACPNCGSTERDEDGDCAECHEPKPAKPQSKPKRARAKKEPKAKRMSGLDAAAKVLEESGEPMNVKQIVELAESKGYWKSPGGKTPWATVYSAIIREVKTRGQDARFRKAERGRFVHA